MGAVATILVTLNLYRKDNTEIQRFRLIEHSIRDIAAR